MNEKKLVDVLDLMNETLVRVVRVLDDISFLLLQQGQRVNLHPVVHTLKKLQMHLIELKRNSAHPQERNQ